MHHQPFGLLLPTLHPLLPSVMHAISLPYLLTRKSFLLLLPISVRLTDYRRACDGLLSQFLKSIFLSHG
jgi:hypothetical protein